MAEDEFFSAELPREKTMNQPFDSRNPHSSPTHFIPRDEGRRSAASRPVYNTYMGSSGSVADPINDICVTITRSMEMLRWAACEDMPKLLQSLGFREAHVCSSSCGKKGRIHGEDALKKHPCKLLEKPAPTAQSSGTPPIGLPELRHTDQLLACILQLYVKAHHSLAYLGAHRFDINAKRVVRPPAPASVSPARSASMNTSTKHVSATAARILAEKMKKQAESAKEVYDPPSGLLDMESDEAFMNLLHETGLDGLSPLEDSRLHQFNELLTELNAGCSNSLHVGLAESPGSDRSDSTFVNLFDPPSKSSGDNLALFSDCLSSFGLDDAAGDVSSSTLVPSDVPAAAPIASEKPVEDVVLGNSNVQLLAHVLAPQTGSDNMGTIASSRPPVLLNTTTGHISDDQSNVVVTKPIISEVITIHDPGHVRGTGGTQRSTSGTQRRTSGFSANKPSAVKVYEVVDLCDDEDDEPIATGKHPAAIAKSVMTSRMSSRRIANVEEDCRRKVEAAVAKAVKNKHFSADLVGPHMARQIACAMPLTMTKLGQLFPTPLPPDTLHKLGNDILTITIAANAKRNLVNASPESPPPSSAKSLPSSDIVIVSDSPARSVQSSLSSRPVASRTSSLRLPSEPPTSPPRSEPSSSIPSTSTRNSGHSSRPTSKASPKDNDGHMELCSRGSADSESEPSADEGEMPKDAWNSDDADSPSRLSSSRKWTAKKPARMPDRTENPRSHKKKSPTTRKCSFLSSSDEEEDTSPKKSTLKKRMISLQSEEEEEEEDTTKKQKKCMSTSSSEEGDCKAKKPASRKRTDLAASSGDDKDDKDDKDDEDLDVEYPLSPE
ncbi:hypothetical protein BV898_16071 [Hypsibius exemplaris]|uniref:Uncharacterized protein n=1 Tax=Hypsibius exemplaris TaxID=2072580 RepID=A0A9X6NJ79_HYPEX|nr:hypothetical protein BV898_16071 [Hypsibius exemplaris]